MGEAKTREGRRRAPELEPDTQLCPGFRSKEGAAMRRDKVDFGIPRRPALINAAKAVGHLLRVSPRGSRAPDNQRAGVQSDCDGGKADQIDLSHAESFSSSHTLISDW